MYILSLIKSMTYPTLRRIFPKQKFTAFNLLLTYFQKHGLSGGSLIELAYALKGKKTHVNFHEIWIGAYPSATLKEKLYGWRQKREKSLSFKELPNHIQ